MSGNAGKWERQHADVDEPAPYGLTETYQLAADFLEPCARVADWGCGTAWMRRHIPPGRYLGVDGSRSAFCDVVADLADYRTTSPGIFIRHVLEHDPRWQLILANAVASFTQRLVLVLFTPLAAVTGQIAFNDDPGVPDIAFALTDITAHFTGLDWASQTLPSSTHYGTETIFYVERKESACPT